MHVRLENTYNHVPILLLSNVHSLPSNAGDEESNSAANSVNNKDIVTAKKRKFRKTSDCRRRDLRTTKEEAVEHVEDDSTKSFRDMLSEPVCRSESFALGDVLLSRRTRTFKRS